MGFGCEPRVFLQSRKTLKQRTSSFVVFGFAMGIQFTIAMSVQTFIGPDVVLRCMIYQGLVTRGMFTSALQIRIIK